MWGIWLGHVFHWHIATAAMQMTMYNHLPAGHKLWPLLEPQSQSLIDFDFVLLTSRACSIRSRRRRRLPGPCAARRCSTASPRGRTFFDDDPLSELKKHGIDVKDFTVKKDWDAYPVAGHLIDIWKICQRLREGVVDDLYKTDTEVANDKGLKAWIDASNDPTKATSRLPDITTRARSRGAHESPVPRHRARGGEP